MGIYIDVYELNKEKLFEKSLLLIPEATFEELEQIFDYFTISCSDSDKSYLIINNELYEDVNPYFKLIATIENKYGCRDFQTKVLHNREVRKELKGFYHEDYEVEEKFNIKLDNY